MKEQFKKGKQAQEISFANCMKLAVKACELWVERSKTDDKVPYESLKGIGCSFQEKHKNSKKNLKRIEEIISLSQEKMHEKNVNLNINKIDFYNKKDNKNNINSLTTIGSGEIKDKKFDKGLKELEKICGSMKSQNQQMPPECEKLLIQKYSEYEDLKTDLQIQGEAKVKYIEANFKSVKSKEEEFKEYLKEHNHIKLLTKLEKNNDIDTIKAELIQLLKAEKESAVVQLHEKFKKKIQTSDKLTKAEKEEHELENKSTKELLKSTHDQLAQKHQKLMNLFQYSNVVSSFLCVSEKDNNSDCDGSNDNSQYNIIGLKKEFEENEKEDFFQDQDYRDLASGDSGEMVKITDESMEIFLGVEKEKQNNNNN